MTSRGQRPATGDRDRRGADEPQGGGHRHNEYFIDGDGLNREVLQSEICRFLGPEATSRRAESKTGKPGYIIKAYRPFTPEMLKDLRKQSAEFEAELAAAPRRRDQRSGREAMEYRDSDARRQFEPSDSRYAGPGGYETAGPSYGQDPNSYNTSPGYGTAQPGFGAPPPQRGYEGGPPFGQQPPFPAGYGSMSQQAPAMTAPVDQGYQSGAPRYQPSYGYGQAPSGNPSYYPQGPGYDSMDMSGHNEPPRGAQQFGSYNPSDRGGAGDRGYGGPPMSGGMLSSGDPYGHGGHGQSSAYQGQPQPYNEQPPRGGAGGGHPSRQSEQSYSSSRPRGGGGGRR